MSKSQARNVVVVSVVLAGIFLFLAVQFKQAVFVPGLILLSWMSSFTALALAPLSGGLRDRLFFVGLGNAGLAAIFGFVGTTFFGAGDRLANFALQIAAVASGGAGGSLIAQFLYEQWRADERANSDG
jgi:hypothetical protein